MQSRATRREIPVDDRHFAVQTSRGAVDFRVPGHRARRPLSVLTQDDPALLGVMIGLGWMHETLDLDSVAPGTRAPLEEWQAFGDAVLLELDDAGWYPAEVDGLAAVLLSEWSERMQVHAEARETIDFFAVTRGGLRSRRSTSSCDISVVGGSGV
jgi:hypothetical protein